MKFTKDNWIKALAEQFMGDINPDTYKLLESFISQVEKDAIEKTNKRWREKIMRFSMPSCPISSMEYPPGWWYSSFGMAIKEDFMRRISDLLEDKS